MFRELFH